MAVDLSPYLQRENSVRSDFAAKSAANAFSRTLAQQRGSRNLSNATMSFNRSLPSFTAGFARRGMAGGGVQSGVMQRAMQQRVGDYTRQLGDINADNFNTDQQYQFDARRFEAERDAALADIAAQRAATIAQTAAAINALKPYMGSY